MKQYLYIEIDNEDHRIQHLYLTEEVQEIISVLLEKRKEVEQYILNGIPQEHLDIVVQTFDRINENVEQISTTKEHVEERNS